MSAIRFARVVVMVRGHEGVQKAVDFYQHGLGLSVLRQTDLWAELACPVIENVPMSGIDSTEVASPKLPQPTTLFHLNIKGVDGEAQLSKGYSPFISFDVMDMDSTVARCAQMGAHLDGPIQYPAHGKVATMRAPDGQMIGLYEPMRSF